MDTLKKSPGEEEGRDWSEASTSQGMPRPASHHQKLGESTGRDSLLRAFEETNPTGTLVFRLLALRPVRN